MSSKLRRKLQKAVAATVSVTTTVWLVGVSAFVPFTAFGAEIADGALIKTADNPNVYIVKKTDNGQWKRLILSANIFNQYGHLSWDKIMTVSQAVLDGYQNSDVVRAFDPANGVDDPKVYLLEPDMVGDEGMRRWVNVTAAQFTDELGYVWDQVYLINAFERDSYSTGSDVNDASDVDDEDDDTSTPSGDGLTVETRSMPASGVTPLSATGVNFLKFTVEAGEDGKITGMVFSRKGVGSNSDFSNVYLYEGDTRLTTGKSVNADSQQVVFNNLNLNFDKGDSRDFNLLVDTSTGTAGNINYFELTSVSADVDINGLPISGTQYSWSASSAGVLTIATGGTPTNPSLGETDALLATFKLTASAAEDIEVERIALTNGGSGSLDGVENWSLLYNDEEVAASSVSGDIVTFVFDTTFLIKKGQSRTFEVRGDLTAGGLKRSETMQLYLDESSDLHGTGKTFGLGTGITNSFSSSTGSTTLTLQGGAITITFSGTPAARDIAVGGDDLVWLDFTVSAEENVEFRSTALRFYDGNSGTGGSNGDITGEIAGNYFTDIKIVDVDSGGAVVGPFDISSMTDTSNYGAKTSTERYTVDAGETRHFQILADVASNATTGGYFVQLQNFGSSTIKSLDTGNFVNTADIVPSTAIVGNTQTVSASAMTITTASTPVSDTFVKGANNIPSVAFLFKAGAASDVTISSVKLTAYTDDTTSGVFVVGTSSVTPAAQNLISSISIYDGATQLGVSKSINSSGEATFNGLNWKVPAGVQKKLDVKVNVPNQTLGNSNSDRFKIDITDVSADVTATDKDGNDITETADAPNGGTADSGTRITVANSGTLSAALDNAATPKSDIVIAGTTGVLFGAFKFTGTDEAFTINKLNIKNGTSTGNYDDDVNTVTLEYPKKDGSTGTKTASFDGTGISTFSALGFYVPKDGSALLKVKYNLEQVAANGGGADSGDLPQAIFDYNTNFEATSEGAGTNSTSTGSADISGNAMTLRNARPTFDASKPSTVGNLVSQTNFDLIDVKVTAAGNDDVALKKMKLTLNLFDVATVGSALTVGGSTQWAIYDVTDLNSELGSNTSAFENGVGGQDPSFTTGNSNSTTTNLYVTFDNEERIQAGTSKTFRIRTRIQNAHENSNGKDNVTVQLATEEDANTRTGAITSSNTNVVLLAATSVSFVWSDLSAGEATHSDTIDGSSSDWTNGFKIKNLPSSSVTHTK